MKKEFASCPETMDSKSLYGFAWEEYVAAIPSPLVVVTSYKDNGLTNATMQSWTVFSSEIGFYCIFANVDKKKHMYQTIHRGGQCVVNFPSAEIYKKCLDTCNHNREEDDEITAAGLTAERASRVNAPRIRECFLNLECEYVWEKEITPGSQSVVMCLKIVNVCMEEEHLDETGTGRYGTSGYLYNIHSPVNALNGKMEEDAIGILQSYKKYSEL